MPWGQGNTDNEQPTTDHFQLKTHNEQLTTAHGQLKTDNPQLTSGPFK